MAQPQSRQRPLPEHQRPHQRQDQEGEGGQGSRARVRNAMERLRNAADAFKSVPKGRHSPTATTAPASSERRAFRPSPPSPSPADAQQDEEEPPDSDTEEEEESDADSDVQNGTSGASNTLTGNASGGKPPPASVPATSSSGIHVRGTPFIVAARATAAPRAKNASAAAASAPLSSISPSSSPNTPAHKAPSPPRSDRDFNTQPPSPSTPIRQTARQTPPVRQSPLSPLSPPRSAVDFNAQSPSPSTPMRQAARAPARQTPPVRQSPPSPASPPRSAASSFGGASPFGRSRDTCYKCGGSGHWAQNCSNDRGSPSPARSPFSGGGSPFGRSRDQDICYMCGSSGHWAQDCPSGSPNRDGQDICFKIAPVAALGRKIFVTSNMKCGLSGHWAQDCPSSPGSPNRFTNSQGSPSRNICYKCGESGHWMKDRIKNIPKGEVELLLYYFPKLNLFKKLYIFFVWFKGVGWTSVLSIPPVSS
ncbi:hypothetical protein B0H14DRAFT_3139333 [Mycena olivaceomarginata]|nr:hypothetical protein B0H14DRAFT_3139333 [Mycena olivaceomarginata]